ncbi:glycosyl hydrolase family 18 protein [Paenibacillus sp. 453mf]|uniref:glycosyl hydrolase family 18 protein n=1 Tax=Paenibacillus sp. 453mf TaxID=1761874 RepID=UPI0008EEDB73|nr:glycosyl hydrolase family 18 protein [Paenibacillus sp. 453mf]SFS93168.1 Copper amine oxidase N-terminal domain-containing protein [Paenibacillus sp. 453mf]
MAKGYRKKRRRKSSFTKRIAAIGFIGVGIYLLIATFNPQNIYEDADWRGFAKPIFVQGELMDYEAVGSGESLQLPLPVLQEAVDPAMRFEDGDNAIILTSPDKVLRLHVGQETAELNTKEYTLHTAPFEEQGIPYVPLQAVKEVYGVTVHEDMDTGAVLLMNAGEVIQYGSAKGKDPEQKIPLYIEPDDSSAIIAQMNPGDRVRIWSLNDEWNYVQMDNGYAGYTSTGKIKPTEKVTVPVPESIPTAAEQRWKGKTINLAWEAVYNRAADPAYLQTMEGVNVVSPTWFDITDGKGSVESKADLEYVHRAKSLGMEVWGLLSNSFDPDITAEALSTYDRRTAIIQKMMDYAAAYELDGINIDFENVYTEDGPMVTQFMRELRPYAKQNDLVLSIAVTPKSNSEMWSLFLDRRALGEIADYMMVMAYDEHWASSPTAGSVASLPWVTAAMNKIMLEDEVPADKLLLGIPSYTRVWSIKESGVDSGITSQAIGMDSAQDLIEQHKLTPTFSEDTGQNYVEFTEGEVRNQIWLEDKISLRARVDLAIELKLAGIATWNRSFANEGAWAVLNRIHQR